MHLGEVGDVGAQLPEGQELHPSRLPPTGVQYICQLGFSIFVSLSWCDRVLYIIQDNSSVPAGGGHCARGLGFRVQGSGFRVQGSGFRVQGSGFRVQGLELSV